MHSAYHPFVALGLLLILIGVLLVLFPFLIKHAPTLEKLEKLPPILVYVYRRNGFYLITSPILILIGIAYFVYVLLRFIR